jgi:hypothetical protein
MDDSDKRDTGHTGLATAHAGLSVPLRRRSPAVSVALLGALLVMLIGAVLVWHISRPAGPGGIVTSPRLVVDRQVIDLGRVQYNQRVKAEFAIGNSGGQPLQIVGRPRVEVVKGC